MPDLLQCLMEHDFGYLLMVAETWQVEAPAADNLAQRAALTNRMLDGQYLNQVFSSLPHTATAAISDMQHNHGRILWQVFTRKYGEVRDFGPGRRDREQPHLQPASTAEILWYRAFISRGFFKDRGILREFAFIPSDILEKLPPPAPLNSPLPSVVDPEAFLPTGIHDTFLDHMCTLLATARTSVPVHPGSLVDMPDLQKRFYTDLLNACGMGPEGGSATVENIKAHLEAPRPLAWLNTVQGWLQSATLNELAMVPGIIVEQSPSYTPVSARQAIISHITGIEPGRWVPIQGFSDQVKSQTPDFLRQSGNYDTWLIRSSDDGSYLTGFGQWANVEGRYISFMITGPLFWLGIVEPGYRSHSGQPEAFRITQQGIDLLGGKTPRAPEENGKILIKAGAVVECEPLTPRQARYTIARMAEWMKHTATGQIYRITPASLTAARKQALRVSHLVALLRKHGAVPPAPILVRALQQWEDSGTRAGIEDIQVLKVDSPELLTKIRQTRANSYLEETLGPTTVVVRRGCKEKLIRILLEQGILPDDKSGL